jgi:hypothetical protein
MIAFAYQMIIPYTSNFSTSTNVEEKVNAPADKRAKALYKKAIRRSECPLGAFNMIISILLRQSRALNTSHEQA